MHRNCECDAYPVKQHLLDIDHLRPDAGSLPCNVNASMTQVHDLQFFEEARRKRELRNAPDYTAIDMESMGLLEDDSLAQNYQTEPPPVELAAAAAAAASADSAAGVQAQQQQQQQAAPAVQVPAKFTSKATLQVSNVDDCVQLPDLELNNDKKTYDLETLQNKVIHSKYSVYIPTYRMIDESKKVDENGNALQQTTNTKSKKKKIQSDKNVVLIASENVEGHRSDIINDIPKLVEFIGGSEALGKRPNVHKSKQLHKQHTSEDGSKGGSKKQRAHSTKGKESRASELKKSNSLGEISTANLADFAFGTDVDADGTKHGDGGAKVALRVTKSNNADRPRERRSWGTVEPPPFPGLSNDTSNEHLENSAAADTWIETKTKKKSKKRRNSVSSGGGRRQATGTEGCARHAHNRAPSPDLRGKVACSVPHSEKSNDSSDVDSVHSLPIDGLNTPISYADIAKNSNDRLKEKKLSPEKPAVEPPPPTVTKVTAVPPPAAPVAVVPVETPPAPVPPAVVKDKVVPPEPVHHVEVRTAAAVVTAAVKTPTVPVKIQTPPDVTNFKSFPAISGGKSHVAQKDAEKVNGGKVVGQQKTKAGPPTPSLAAITAGKGAKNGGVSNAKVALPVTVPTQNDINIQNDLTIIQANERENIQFNAQRLPPNIPDVQSIEKHFLSGARGVQPSEETALPPDSPPSASSSSSVVSHETVAMGDTVNTNGLREASTSTMSSSSEEDQAPPVVILSGVNGKEVPGLVFGFEVNEQLLNEDVCETFKARYYMPEQYDSRHHDKIVNFIGLAWESVVNQSSDKVVYYVNGQ
ncbi:uncharacterized protein LOC109604854 isoform X3 [Aethina tumida]|uniref:uncharacterized protein LOC109604854 isoform X3 n=1 Tax=Aethina tumida TaxID=116153 RepID=UPI002148270E|nr:uncharacterized protein LOC109604854 isoform X3 [Aethina tumida]